MTDPERRRLEGIFQRALGASLIVSSTVACSHGSSSSARSNPADASADSGCSAEFVELVYTSIDGQADYYTRERLACGVPSGVTPVDAGCTFSLADCQMLCPTYGACSCKAAADSCLDGGPAPRGLVVECDLDCIGNLGRRPAGFVPAESAAKQSTLGAFFSRAAELEAASVHAFVELGKSLRAFGAPRELVASARRAARDEVRHARIMRRLAQQFGSHCAALHIARNSRQLSFEEFALDNAVEGCVRETYAALVASWQARRAQNPAFARVLAVIAEDETRHAALAWAIARWVHPRLARSRHERVRSALECAVLELRMRARNPPLELATALGLPGLDDQSKLLNALDREAWQAEAAPFV